MKIKRALISVSDKTGLEDLTNILIEAGVELIASGGTAKFLEDKGYGVTMVEKLTGNPEAFGGRLKTLSFELIGSILFRREDIENCLEAEKLGLAPIDLIVCNLYPFPELAKKGRTWKELVENIDIGGVTLIRAGAKNYSSVVVLTDPTQYREFMELFCKKNGSTHEKYRKQLAHTAYRHTASYDKIVCQYWEGGRGERRELRYGENPHQKGWVSGEEGLAAAVPLQGKALSWNNLLDSDAACGSCWDLHFFRPDEYVVVVIKHGNPCGAAVGSRQPEALALSWAGDSVSAFGSILCFNQEVTEESALWLKDKFVEVIIAPGFTLGARNIFIGKKNLRLIALAPRPTNPDELSCRSIDGGYLLQEPNLFKDDTSNFEVVSEKEFSQKQKYLAIFGERVCRHLKSNAIALVREIGNAYQLIGAGMGNPNRLLSTEQAINQARANGVENLSDCILISDAFFPFRDNIDLASQEGVRCVVQPGGSRRDAEVITACNEHNMSMAFTGRRHFCH